MATRASNKKETKSLENADTSAVKSVAPAAPAPATDLITPKKKRAFNENRNPTRSGVPPISKANQAETDTAAGQPIIPVAEPAQSTPPQPVLPPKQESVSLIDIRKGKSGDQEAKPKSVLPPISKILAPRGVKSPEPEAKPASLPAPLEPVIQVEVTENVPGEKVVHLKPPIIVRELALQIGL
ncbi:MAG: hypothetical protein JO076_08715, partial [Verrucomicrobia bacterium]|nr:hypothetical protein [Verrucomicrobiota bacterium]